MRPFGYPVTILNTLDHLGNFNGKADEGFFVGYSTNIKAYRVFNNRTRIVEENLHAKFSEEIPNIAGNGPNWLFDIDVLTIYMSYKPVVAGNQTNDNACTKENIDVGQDGKKIVPDQKYILLPLLTSDPSLSKSLKDSPDARFKSSGESQDKYVADILKKFDFATMKTTSTPIETNKALLKDEEAEDVDVYLYRSMIGSLMYLTTSRPDIMFVVCACARFQVTSKVSHLHAMKSIFRYLKGQPKLGLWYPRDSPFDLEAFSDSDYAGASLDRKSTTGDETVIKEWEDRMERAATTASSLETEQYNGSGPRCQDTILEGAEAQIRFEAASKQSNDPPLSRVNTLGSGEDSMKLKELMEFCTKII
ncbi:hypothetical protein Tco_0282586 [Tanacetum coccineum]